MEIIRYVGEDTIEMIRTGKIDVVELLELSDDEIDYADGHRYRRCSPITIIIPDNIGLMARPIREEIKKELAKLIHNSKTISWENLDDTHKQDHLEVADYLLSNYHIISKTGTKHYEGELRFDNEEFYLGDVAIEDLTGKYAQLFIEDGE